MPIYLFRNKNTGKIVEIVLGMNDKKEYKGENGDEEGTWEREYSVPCVSTDTFSKVDPFSKSQFSTATSSKNITYGEAMDFSRELSEKRKDKDGKDIVKENMYNSYSRERGGKRHPSQEKEKRIEKLKNMGVSIDIPQKTRAERRKEAKKKD